MENSTQENPTEENSTHCPIQKTQRMPMLSTPCESVQICTDPDRYSRIFRKLTSQKTVLKLKLVE